MFIKKHMDGYHNEIDHFEGTGAINFFSIDEIKNRLLWILLEEGVWEKYSLLGKDRSRLIAAKQDRDLDGLCRLILAS